MVLKEEDQEAEMELMLVENSPLQQEKQYMLLLVREEMLQVREIMGRVVVEPVIFIVQQTLNILF